MFEVKSIRVSGEGLEFVRILGLFGKQLTWGKGINLSLVLH